MDFCYDPDFDLLLDELRQDATSSEDYSSIASSSSTLSPPLLTLNLGNKKPKANRKSKIADDSSIDSDSLVIRPRILKTDIRRSYATMLMNVLNNGDFPLIYGFLETFFVSNMENSFTRPNHLVSNMSESITLKQDGIKDAAMFWYSHSLLKPDAVITLNDCNIVTPSNSSESQIVTHFSFQATVTLEELPKSYVECPSKCVDSLNTEMVAAGHKRSKSCEEEEKSKTMKDLMASVDNAVQRLSLLADPFKIDAIGKVIMYLDENKRVKKIEMKCIPNESMKQHCAVPV